MKIEKALFLVKKLLFCTLSQLKAEKENTKEWNLSASKTSVSIIDSINVFIRIVSILSPDNLKQILEKAGLQYMVRVASEDDDNIDKDSSCSDENFI